MKHSTPTILVVVSVFICILTSCGGGSTVYPESGSIQQDQIAKSGSWVSAPAIEPIGAIDWATYGNGYANMRIGSNGPVCDGSVSVEGTASAWTIPGQVSSTPVSVITNLISADEDTGFFLFTDNSQLFFINGMQGTPQLIYGLGNVQSFYRGVSPAIDKWGNVLFLTTEVLNGVVVNALRVYVPSESRVYSEPIAMSSPMFPFRQMCSPTVVDDPQSDSTEIYVATLTDTNNWESTIYRFDFDPVSKTLSQTWSRTVDGYVTGPCMYFKGDEDFVVFTTALVGLQPAVMLHAVSEDNSIVVEEQIDELPVRTSGNELATNYPVQCSQFFYSPNYRELIALATNDSGPNGARGRVHFYDLEFDERANPPAWEFTAEGLYAGTSYRWTSGPAVSSGLAHSVYDDSDCIFLNRSDGHVTAIDCGSYQEDIGWNLTYVSDQPLALKCEWQAQNVFGYSSGGQNFTVGRADNIAATTNAIFPMQPAGVAFGAPMCSRDGCAYVPACYQIPGTGYWRTELWQFVNP